MDSTVWDAVYPYVAALLPTIGILFLFYVVIRNVLEADRRERRAQAEWEAARAREEAPPRSQSEPRRAGGDHASEGSDPDDNKAR